VLCLLREALDESLAHLLSRLDLAIASAQTDDIFTDEIGLARKLEAPLAAGIPSLQEGGKQCETNAYSRSPIDCFEYS
jgi:hypothetical protein